jgi:esterase/lipase superfamily enzyme
MKPTFPSDADLAALARQVDDQLNALQTAPAARVQLRGVAPGERAELPAAPEQQAVIEHATGEPFETFWQKYKRHARRDLCLPGGQLYEQWQKWRDLQSKDAVKMSLAALASMGLSTANVPAVAVAATVFLLNVVTKIGIEAVCEGCAEEQFKHAKPPSPPTFRPIPKMEDSRAGAAAEQAKPQTKMVSATGPGGTPLFTIWYGTNRQPADASDHSKGYSGSRASTVSYGTCQVAVPRSHKFGSVGSPWWKRWLTLDDDRLRLTAIAALAEAQFWNSVRASISGHEPADRVALIFLHGFNVSFEEAAIRAAQIGFDLKVPGLTGFFSWPSKGNVAQYPEDEATIEASEAAITDFLVRFATDSGAQRVHLIAHSMGNRGLLRAMQRIQANAAHAGAVKFGQIFLAAPDLDVDLFRSLAAVYPQFSERTTLYASPGDKAVGLSQWLHGAPRAGFTPPITVVNGIDTVEVPDFNLDALGHSYFSQAAGVLHDMFDLIRHNEAPDNRQRTERHQTPEGAFFWKIIA